VKSRFEKKMETMPAHRGGQRGGFYPKQGAYYKGADQHHKGYYEKKDRKEEHMKNPVYQQRENFHKKEQELAEQFENDEI